VTTPPTARRQAPAAQRPPSGGPSRLADRKRLGDILVESGLLTAAQLDQALVEQRRADAPRRRLGQVVSDLRFATERQVAEALANLLGLRMIDLSKSMPAPDVVRLLPRAVAERTRVLVLDKTAKGLVVAAADPTNVLALDDVKLYTRSPEIEVLVATDSQIRDHLVRAWSLGEDSSAAAMVEETVEEDDQDTSFGSTDEEAPIVKLVNRIFGDAVKMRASDIHVEVQRDTLRVRFRIDGLLRDMMTAPRRIATAVISRIKIMSGLDISERRIPRTAGPGSRSRTWRSTAGSARCRACTAKRSLSGC
jgi:type IV pilus assembly protein PilB